MEDKLFNKHFIGITILNFIVYMVYYLFTVIIAFIATKELGVSTSQAGLATGIYIVGTLIARLIFGKQLEVLGRKLVLRGGYFLLTNNFSLFLYAKYRSNVFSSFPKWFWLWRRVNSN